MTSMKWIQHRYSRITILFFTLSYSSSAGSELKLVRTSINSLDVQFATVDHVSGVQFRVQTSSCIVLQSVKPGIRVGKSWIVDYYIANDSTVNVLVLNMGQNSFSTGWIALTTILFTIVKLQEKNSVVLLNVMVINENGDSLGVTITNLYLTPNILPAISTDELKTFILYPNFPNPFNPSTIVAYRLNTDAKVQLSVYDITGREVKRLVDQYQYAGEYNVKWNSNSNDGRTLTSGTYFARLNVGKSSAANKMLLNK